MKGLAKTLQQAITHIDLPVTERQRYISILLGYSIGAQLPMPSESVSNSRIYWVNHQAGIARGIIDQINEEFVVDTGVVIDIAARVWAMRYRLVYPTVGDFGSSWNMLPLTDCPDMPSDAKKLLDEIKVARGASRHLAIECFAEIGKQFGAK